MKQRCRDKNDPSYKHYGERGILICDRWNNYANFREDMGEPNGDESIERIDNSGPYSPENCRWATKKEQNRNTRKNVFVTFDGETKCIGEWAEITGIHIRALHTRIKRGWDIERAFNEPLRRW